MLRDPNTVMLSTIVNILATTVPLAALLWVYPSHLLGIFNIVFNVAMWMERYILCLHYAEHRTLFEAPSRWEITSCHASWRHSSASRWAVSCTPCGDAPH